MDSHNSRAAGTSSDANFPTIFRFGFRDHSARQWSSHDTPRLYDHPDTYIGVCIVVHCILSQKV
jgi:hypothetical protein